MKLRGNRFILKITALALLMAGCATYKTQYKQPDKERKTEWPESEITHKVFLVGDAGYVGENGRSPALGLLEQKLSAAGANSNVIFLGDNVYPKGLPSKHYKQEHEAARRALNYQLEILKNYQGRPFFIPGNHDWGYGRDAVERQEDYIQEYLNEEIYNRKDEDDWEQYFLPENACPGPEDVVINENLAIVFIDSQWWLENWDQEPQMHEACFIRSRKDFAFFFEDVLRKHRHKNVIVATHHGIESYGPHGGHYTFKSHFFPLSEINPDLKIPLPGIGSVAMLTRAAIGTRQDLSNGNYQNLVDAMVGAAKKNGRYIFASGHEHSMQYIETEDQYQIIAGSGSKKEGTRLTRNAQFTSSDRGFAELGFTDDGETYLRYWSAEGDEGKVLYSKKISGKLEQIEKNIPQEFPEYPPTSDSAKVHPVKYEIKPQNGWGEFWLGENYREMYLQKYQFPVLDLQKFKGGVVPVEQGGGNQTNSLRLQDSAGNIYNMRSVTKDASRLLPYPFNKLSMAKELIRDNFLSTHAWGAVAVPPLADAVDVYHTNPRLYYIPRQPNLGRFNVGYGGEVYLIERRIDAVWPERDHFGNPEDIQPTDDVVEKLIEEHDVKVNQKRVVRSRLFDQVVGDWDRHDGQWEWAEKEKNGWEVYEPIPRDRDQIFSKYDGAIPWLASRFPSGFLHQLKPYSDDIDDIRWATWSPRYFERTFTNEMEWKDWKREAEFLKENLTDSVVEEAFALWPKKVQELTAGEIKGHLRARRKKIVDIARRMYLNQAREVDVLGTEKKERFDIHYYNSDSLEIKMWDSNSDADRQKLLYQRTFLTDETEEIHIYGMEDEDHFFITGKAGRSPLLRLIGGLEKDYFVDNSQISSLVKKHWVYDRKDAENELEGKELKDKRTNRQEYNVYNHRAKHYEYDIFFPLPYLSFNVENGLSLGATATWTRHKFKKSPYGSLHQMEASYAFGSGAPELKYNGEYVEAFGPFDFNLRAEYQGAQFTTNFFGLGNETPNNRSIDFYRIDQEILRIFPALQKRMAGDDIRFRAGPKFMMTDFEDRSESFINTVAPSLSEEIFERKFFGGARAELNWDGRDNFLYTRRGGKLNLYGEWANNLENGNDAFMHGGDLSVYVPLTRSENLTLATRVGYSSVEGEYEFFQAPALGEQARTLGDEGSLRGYRFDRFRGDTRFYHNIDLRLRLFGTEKAIIPFSMGVFGGFDYGRVWLEGENSNQWHNGYGGGLWIAPIDYLVLSAGYFQSTEDDRIYINLGFPF